MMGYTSSDEHILALMKRSVVGSRLLEGMTYLDVEQRNRVHFGGSFLQNDKKSIKKWTVKKSNDEMGNKLNRSNAVQRSSYLAAG